MGLCFASQESPPPGFTVDHANIRIVVGVGQPSNWATPELVNWCFAIQFGRSMPPRTLGHRPSELEKSEAAPITRNASSPTSPPQSNLPQPPGSFPRFAPRKTSRRANAASSGAAHRHLRGQRRQGRLAGRVPSGESPGTSPSSSLGSVVFSSLGSAARKVDGGWGGWRG